MIVVTAPLVREFFLLLSREINKVIFVLVRDILMGRVGVSRFNLVTSSKWLLQVHDWLFEVVIAIIDGSVGYVLLLFLIVGVRFFVTAAKEASLLKLCKTK